VRDWLTWVVVTPLLFRLADRFPLGRSKLGSRLTLYSVATMVVLSLCIAFESLIDPGFHPNQSPPGPGFSRGEHRDRAASDPGKSQPNHPHTHPTVNLVRLGTFQLPLYLMIISAAHASVFYTRDRERAVSLARARLDVLTAQLQPHFLFNTLNMIAELVHEDQNKADAMITALSEMLRLTLNANATDLVPLGDEARFIERYFKIMQARFGARLQYECDITAAARRGLVPPFLLQPLVENSIRHGLEGLKAGGKVTIRGEVKNKLLHVLVQDNGAGLSATNVKPEGLGLTNTRERLRQLFGDSASLTIKQCEGVTVEMSLPFTTVR
jgi:LytS/YehU family sensor histidine kinase